MGLWDPHDCGVLSPMKCLSILSGCVAFQFFQIRWFRVPLLIVIIPTAVLYIRTSLKKRSLSEFYSVYKAFLHPI